MKRKIGKLYNKTIIEGDINLKTPNEIHKNELRKGGGELDKSEWKYYDISQIDGTFNSDGVGYKNGICLISYLAKQDDNISIANFFTGSDNNDVDAVGIPYNKPIDMYNPREDIQVNTIGELFEYSLLSFPDNIKSLIKEISEEEFYNTSI